MLLSDASVQKLLSDKVVTSWEMVREVPKVSIDFGNGKKLDRTLKGNTVMYLCSPDGKVLDAWPGVYTPQDFKRQLEGVLAELKEAQIDPGKPLDAATELNVRAYHRRAVSGLGAIFDMPIEMTMSKMGVESPILKMLGERPTLGTDDLGPVLSKQFSVARTQSRAFLGRTLIGETPDYAKLLERYTAKLHDASLEPMTSRQVRDRTGGANSTASPEELGLMAVREDSRVNSFYVRPAVHLLLSGFDKLPSPTDAKLPVFKTILQVPIDDPYLGLTDVLPPGTRGGS